MPKRRPSWAATRAIVGLALTWTTMVWSQTATPDPPPSSSVAEHERRPTAPEESSSGADAPADASGSTDADSATGSATAEPGPATAEPTPEGATPPTGTHPTEGAVGAPPAPVTGPGPTLSAPRAAELPTTARVQIYVNRAGAWLELRDDLTEQGWTKACDAPCDRTVTVYGTQARVNGPGMTPSNEFRIEPGAGAARLKVKAGSARLRRAGIALLAAGLPVTAAAFATYGYGELNDQAGLRMAGGIGIGVGAAAVLTSFVFVNRGATRVRDARGRRIAGHPPVARSPW